jgi:hypothetical protein
MAQFTKVNSDFQPVMNYDAPDYTVGAVNAITSAATVQPQGPKLEFFTIALASVAANTTIANTVITTVEQLATIHIYEFTDTSTDTLALAVYPVGAWTTATLTTAVDNATGGSSTVTGTATFTN